MISIRPEAVAITDWDDLPIGQPVHLGAIDVPAALVARFDAAFVGPRRDADSSASTMLLIGLLMRLMCDSHLSAANGLGAAAIPLTRRQGPVPIGSSLTCDMTTLAKRPLGSRPGVGIADVAFTARNASGETVFDWRSNQLFAIRDTANAVASEPARPEPALPIAEDSVGDGDWVNLGAYRFSHDSIVRFAKHFDPQRFHLDDEAARSSLFGALCASGWHTCAVWMRIFRDYLTRQDALNRFPEASPPLPDIFELRDLQWRKPVFVDDHIVFAARAIGCINVAASPPATVYECKGTNGAGDIVFSLKLVQPE